MASSDTQLAESKRGVDLDLHPGRFLFSFVFAWMVAAAPSVRAQNYEIMHQQLDHRRNGITVIRAWGSRYEMGFAQGAALAEDIEKGVSEVRAFAGTNYSVLREMLSKATWLPAETEEEIDGMVAGVKSVLLDADLDALDIKAVNTYGDWGYACRSHSSWGRYAAPPFKTLSTRRLDFSAPFETIEHHVLTAWDPADDSVRWVNFAVPGYVAVITAVNAYGTMVSLHDYQSGVSTETGVMPRSMATRLILTGMEPTLDVSEHLDWAALQLQGFNVATGTFINYYAPEGAGGVFTCSAGGVCNDIRLPHEAFFHGEVLLTTNQQTDGASAPPDDTFMENYYMEGDNKDLESHYTLMGQNGLHLMSVGYRGPEDMLIWAEGRITGGVTDRVEFEWSELFEESPGQQDGGVYDGGAIPDGGGSDEAPGGGGGCGCRSALADHSSNIAFLLFPAALLIGGALKRNGSRRKRAKGNQE